MLRWCLHVVALAVVRGDDAHALQALGEVASTSAIPSRTLSYPRSEARLNQSDMMTSGGSTAKTVMSGQLGVRRRRGRP